MLGDAVSDADRGLLERPRGERHRALAGESVLYLRHRPAEAPSADRPPRARYKLHSFRLSDRTRLVTLILYFEDPALGLHQSLVSTAPRGEGEVLARGYGHADQPVILGFGVEAAGFSLATA